MKVLMDSTFQCLVARWVAIAISESSSKNQARNSFSRSLQLWIDSLGSFINHLMATPLRLPMNECARMAAFDTTHSVWDGLQGNLYCWRHAWEPLQSFEVVHVLIRRTFAIEGPEDWSLEFWGIRNQILFKRIWSGNPHFLKAAPVGDDFELLL